MSMRVLTRITAAIVISGLVFMGKEIIAADNAVRVPKATERNVVKQIPLAKKSRKIVPKTTKPTKTYSKEDLEILAHLINGEAGATYCSDEMRYMVGAVVLNRVKRDDFPDTIKEVVFQEGQYACTWDGNFDKKPTKRCYEIAKDLLENGYDIPVDVVFQAEFKQGTGVYKKVQNMYFCYGRK